MPVCLPERAPEELRFLNGYMADAPDDLGGGAAFASAPRPSPSSRRRCTSRRPSA